MRQINYQLTGFKQQNNLELINDKILRLDIHVGIFGKARFANRFLS